MIDYEKISSAVAHYETKGYQYIEAPWIVSLDTMLITRPFGARLFSTFAGELVASGEQSFLEIRDKLKPGKYQCVTPCFRDEKTPDKYHLQYFVKNELIWVTDKADIPVSKLLYNMINDAKEFFSQYGKIEVIDAPLDNALLNQDIMMQGIELGSYGIRIHQDFTWVYGTGCAEPRLSQILEN